MKRILTFLSSVILVHALSAQTLTDTQMRNARATGFAIVASRNPGVTFSIYVIPWNSSYSTLEANANAQINSGWHAQAAIKGNFLNQTFDGSDFSQYSSVVVSEADFALYKSYGTQWWIICSTLPPFSSCVNGDVNGNLYVPKNLLVTGTIQSASSTGLALVPTSGDALIYRNNPGNLVLSSGSGTSDVRINFSYGGGSGGLSVFDGGSQNYANFKVNSNGNLNIVTNGGKVGIGTNPANPTSIDSKLTVAGDIHSSEVKVSVGAGADFVFDDSYDLKSLTEVLAYIKANKHLPEIAPAAEMETNGVELGKMNIKLLQKIEELTLYLINLSNDVNVLKEENQKLQQELSTLRKD